jgi:hypothetical protein
MGEVYEPRSGCPINATIEVFGDRWSLLVLRDIVFADRRYFVLGPTGLINKPARLLDREGLSLVAPVIVCPASYSRAASPTSTS